MMKQIRLIFSHAIYIYIYIMQLLVSSKSHSNSANYKVINKDNLFLVTFEAIINAHS
jgi:hypothetical protein